LQKPLVDGKLTACCARLVKHNTQLKDDGTGLPLDLQQHILQALKRHPLFEMAARPKGVRSPLFSRYPSGMCYGTHVDTHSLSVLTLHRVEPVTQGVRLAGSPGCKVWCGMGAIAKFYSTSTPLDKPFLQKMVKPWNLT
jgi:predicted 2-oxoglutarate/Fe(II)-dependent dioxygenase YbiX